MAKDYDNMRACHVVEVPALAPDVIATIGQAFELRLKSPVIKINISLSHNMLHVEYLRKKNSHADHMRTQLADSS